MTALKDQRKSAPVNSIGWPHARARAVADLVAVDFYFAIIRSATGRTHGVLRYGVEAKATPARSSAA